MPVTSSNSILKLFLSSGPDLVTYILSRTTTSSVTYAAVLPGERLYPCDFGGWYIDNELTTNRRCACVREVFGRGGPVRFFPTLTGHCMIWLQLAAVLLELSIWVFSTLRLRVRVCFVVGHTTKQRSGIIYVVPSELLFLCRFAEAARVVRGPWASIALVVTKCSVLSDDSDP